MIRSLARVAAPCAIFLAACSSEPGGTEHRSAVDHGEVLFLDESLAVFSCSTCHRARDDVADGRILSGAVLAGAIARPSYWGGQERDLLRSINHCRFYFQGHTERWTPDDVEAEAMYAFLASLPETHTGAAPFTLAKVAADVAAGDEAKGADVYARACHSCHGTIHDGAGRLTERAPRIPDETIAEHAMDGFDDTEQRLIFVEKIRHGGFLGYSGFMPPFSMEVLSDEELGQLLSYLGLYSL